MFLKKRTSNLRDSANFSPFYLPNSHISFAKGLHPSPRSPYAPKAPLFAFRESASLSPLLAKNQRTHYCSLDSDFLHHEAGEFSGASHEFNTDSAESQNLRENKTKIAESSDKIQFKKSLKSFCFVWLLPNEESPLSFNYNLPNKVVSQNLPKSQLKG